MSKLYLPFDCETGGFDPTKTDLLTAYFGIFDENFQKLDELDLKLRPDHGGYPIAEEGALKVNGIDLAKHMADPETIAYSQGKARLQALLKKHLKKQGKYSNLRPLGHNLPFDINWVQHHLIKKDEWDKTVHYGILDTKALADLLKDSGIFPSDTGTLVSVAKFLGVAMRNAHNAKEDTLMCVDSYRAMIDLLKSLKAGGGGQKQDLISLLEAE